MISVTRQEARTVARLQESVSSEPAQETSKDAASPRDVKRRQGESRLFGLQPTTVFPRLLDEFTTAPGALDP